MPLKVMQEISAMAKRHGLKTHLDGARLWNAWYAMSPNLPWLTLSILTPALLKPFLHIFTHKASQHQASANSNGELR
jgi:hypothetical protein